MFRLVDNLSSQIFIIFGWFFQYGDSHRGMANYATGDRGVPLDYQ